MTNKEPPSRSRIAAMIQSLRANSLRDADAAAKIALLLVQRKGHYERELQWVTEQLKRLETPPATLSADFVIPAPEPCSCGGTRRPEIEFDCGDACVRFACSECGDGDELDGWPFNEEFVYADDAQRLGFAVV